jgi:uncharacterized cupredoxin-like copper-binding protein
MKLATIGAVGLGVGLIGCGGGGGTKSAAPKSAAPGASTGAAVQVKETEYKLNPSNLNVKKSGSVTFKAVNNGKIAHSLEVEGNGLEKRISGTIQPGSSKSLAVNLKPGKYEWYCPVDGHKALGMKGEITVAGGAGGASGGKSSSSPKGTGGGGGSGY